ncbi:MAG: YbaB/EbfC family nucleoid-associated protein [Clostridia bacterium]
MAKFGAFRGMTGGGGGGMPNMQQLMKQAQEMQEQLAQAKEEIAEAEFEGVAASGAVTITLNGNKELLSIKLEPSIVDPEDVEMLEDLIVVAFNDAKTKAEKFAEETMPQGANGLI